MLRGPLKGFYINQIRQYSPLSYRSPASSPYSSRRTTSNLYEDESTSDLEEENRKAWGRELAKAEAVRARLQRWRRHLDAMAAHIQLLESGKFRGTEHDFQHPASWQQHLDALEANLEQMNNGNFNGVQNRLDEIKAYMKDSENLSEQDSKHTNSDASF